MDKIASTTCILELLTENLVIATQLEPVTYVLTIKVYEREHFFDNPDFFVNQTQIDQYSVRLGSPDQTIAEIRYLYAGWSKIDRTQPTELIGIHNQSRTTLFIQFTLDQRSFIYKRCLPISREMVYEELFGRKQNFHLRALSHDDEQYLISKLRFIPKTKKAISFYPMKTSYSFIHAKRHLSFR